MLDGGAVLPVIIVERFERGLEEAAAVLAQVNGFGVEMSLMLLHSMHLLEVALDHLVRVVGDRLLLLRRHLHSHRLLGADSAIGVLLLEDIPVDPMSYDKGTRLNNMLRQPVSVRLKYRDLVANLMVLFLSEVFGFLYIR